MGPRHVSDTSFPEDHFNNPEGGSALLDAHEASVAVGKRHDEEMGPMPHASATMTARPAAIALKPANLRMIASFHCFTCFGCYSPGLSRVL